MTKRLKKRMEKYITIFIVTLIFLFIVFAVIEILENQEDEFENSKYSCCTDGICFYSDNVVIEDCREIAVVGGKK